jgi:hypothetical protein
MPAITGTLGLRVVVKQTHSFDRAALLPIEVSSDEDLLRFSRTITNVPTRLPDRHVARRRSGQGRRRGVAAVRLRSRPRYDVFVEQGLIVEFASLAEQFVGLAHPEAVKSVLLCAYVEI